MLLLLLFGFGRRCNDYGPFLSLNGLQKLNRGLTYSQFILFAFAAVLWKLLKVLVVELRLELPKNGNYFNCRGKKSAPKTAIDFLFRFNWPREEEVLADRCITFDLWRKHLLSACRSRRKKVRVAEADAFTLRSMHLLSVLIGRLT